jgi:hypothetical protein
MQADGFRDLVRTAQAGDPKAVERLFQAVLPLVEGLVRARGLRAGDSVSDHAQNACVRILTRLDQFRGAQEAKDDAQVVPPFPRLGPPDRAYRFLKQRVVPLTE